MPFFTILISCRSPNQNSKVFLVSCKTKSANLFEIWKIILNTYQILLYIIKLLSVWIYFYIQRDVHKKWTYTLNIIYTKGLTYRTIYIWKRYAHEKGIYTKKYIYKGIYIEWYIYKEIYNIIGKYMLVEDIEKHISMKRDTHGVTYT